MYVLLATQNPYPIIVYFWSILWQIINLIIVTFGQMIFLLSKSQKRATYPFEHLHVQPEKGSSLGQSLPVYSTIGSSSPPPTFCIGQMQKGGVGSGVKFY